MILRIAGAGLVLLALAACEPAGPPITEEIFVTNPAGVNTAPLSSAIVTETPIDGGGNTPGGIDPALAMVEEDPYGQVIESSASGLTERLPDTCKLETYSYLKGLTAGAVQAAGFTEPYRVIGPSDIVTQEYNPGRVNFYTDNSGKIERIACG
jgi:hypothetical protein